MCNFKVKDKLIILTLCKEAYKGDGLNEIWFRENDYGDIEYNYAYIPYHSTVWFKFVGGDGELANLMGETFKGRRYKGSVLIHINFSELMKLACEVWSPKIRMMLARLLLT